MKGLLVLDWLDRQAEFETEVGGYFRAGTVKHREAVVKGLDQAVGAFLGLFKGENMGKMVVELA
jgi:NADPH-dependent curcumin reductase CurA